MITSLILASQLTVFCEEQRDFAELVMKAQKTGVTMAQILRIPLTRLSQLWHTADLT